MTASWAHPLREIPYAGDALRVLAESQGLAVCEMSVPAGFPGPPPHIHYDFDEAIYVVDGMLQVLQGSSIVDAPAGTLILAARGIRHTFSNPGTEHVRVLGLWGPGSALAFIEDIGAVLPMSGPPDPARLAEVYRRHNSEVVP
jgi:mannose-6-phosphate isomerase-like protein (cupin superfamily)